MYSSAIRSRSHQHSAEVCVCDEGGRRAKRRGAVQTWRHVTHISQRVHIDSHPQQQQQNTEKYISARIRCCRDGRTCENHYMSRHFILCRGASMPYIFGKKTLFYFCSFCSWATITIADIFSQKKRSVFLFSVIEHTSECMWHIDSFPII